MIRLEITLPDALAQEAAEAGLLSPKNIERILRESLRAERTQRVHAKFDVKPVAPMTPDEINAEIEAFRVKRQHANNA